MWDLSNEYVGTADTAGIVPLISLIVIIVLGFRYIGEARASAQRLADKNTELFVWAFGASLLANVVAFFGIGYFDQTRVAWYAILSMICVVTSLTHTNPIPAEDASASLPNYGEIPWHNGLKASS
jgi:hypothetical protein